MIERVMRGKDMPKKIGLGVLGLVCPPAVGYMELSETKSEMLTDASFKEKKENLPTLLYALEGQEFGDINGEKVIAEIKNPRAGKPILSILNEYHENFGMVFHPFYQCNEVYIQSPRDKNVYILQKDFIRFISDDEIGELITLARDLGAKSSAIYSIQETSKEKHKQTKEGTKADVKIIKVGEEIESQYDEATDAYRKVCHKEEFKKSRKPLSYDQIVSKLFWLKNNQSIISYIDAVCNQHVCPVSKSFQIDEAANMYFGKNLAAKIDASVRGIGGGISSSFKQEVQEKKHTSLEFSMTF